MNRLYEQIPEYPAAYDGAGVWVRLIDGLGFRLRWATEGLRPEDLLFTPDKQVMTIGQLINHIDELVVLVAEAMGVQIIRDVGGVDQVLSNLEGIRNTGAGLDEKKFDRMTIRDHPFWHAINGPLADALTHVGQINTLRRLAGNPAPRVSVFKGKSEQP